MKRTIYRIPRTPFRPKITKVRPDYDLPFDDWREPGQIGPADLGGFQPPLEVDDPDRARRIEPLGLLHPSGAQLVRLIVPPEMRIGFGVQHEDTMEFITTEAEIAVSETYAGQYDFQDEPFDDE